MQFVIVGLVFLVLFVIACVAVFAFAGQKSKETQELKEREVPMLRYRVPQGRDPIVVLSALRQGGIEALPDSQDSGGSTDVLIPCPRGTETLRERVRGLIEAEDRINLEGDRAEVGPVRFADEGDTGTGRAQSRRITDR
ncbi:hypothetical protein [Nocardioides terrisoli]|uniref:hypothetical protein n=1 Tax=Nocardioides terrisoli TaxID=3388267 RepID=UPI00287BA485|nr:hypothetical protein [Nocardioides marmorisolisilvae]